MREQPADLPHRQAVAHPQHRRRSQGVEPELGVRQVRRRRLVRGPRLHVLAAPRAPAAGGVIAGGEDLGRDDVLHQPAVMFDLAQLGPAVRAAGLAPARPAARLTSWRASILLGTGRRAGSWPTGRPGGRRGSSGGGVLPIAAGDSSAGAGGSVNSSRRWCRAAFSSAVGHCPAAGSEPRQPARRVAGARQRCPSAGGRVAVAPAAPVPCDEPPAVADSLAAGGAVRGQFGEFSVQGGIVLPQTVDLPFVLFGQICDNTHNSGRFRPLRPPIKHPPADTVTPIL